MTIMIIDTIDSDSEVDSGDDAVPGVIKNPHTEEPTSHVFASSTSTSGQTGKV